MTKEEIIKGLESVKKECGKHLDESFAWICEPIDGAIKALEQQSDDCVSIAELEKWLDLNFSFGGACRKLELFERLEKELPRATPTFQTSDDCVSRQAVIKALNCEISGSIESSIDLSKYKREFQEFANMILNAQEKTIQSLPPVIPTRKVGRWVKKSQYGNDYCSECDYEHCGYGYPKYCPNCGSKMEEK